MKKDFIAEEKAKLRAELGIKGETNMNIKNSIFELIKPEDGPTKKLQSLAIEAEEVLQELNSIISNINDNKGEKGEETMEMMENKITENVKNIIERAAHYSAISYEKSKEFSYTTVYEIARRKEDILNQLKKIDSKIFNELIKISSSMTTLVAYEQMLLCTTVECVKQMQSLLNKISSIRDHVSEEYLQECLVMARITNFDVKVENIIKRKIPLYCIKKINRQLELRKFTNHKDLVTFTRYAVYNSAASNGEEKLDHMLYMIEDRDITIFANPHMGLAQQRLLLRADKSGLDVTSISNPKYSASRMLSMIVAQENNVEITDENWKKSDTMLQFIVASKVTRKAFLGN